MKVYNLKLTDQQAEALYYILKRDMETVERNVGKKLVKMLVKRIYKRLRNHNEDTPNKAFRMQLIEEVEIAFYLYFRLYDFDDTHIYERGFIESKLAEIDKRIC